jgi:hypothetical protein
MLFPRYDSSKHTLSLEFGASLLFRRHSVPDMLNFLVNSTHHTMEDRTPKELDRRD